MSYHLQFFRQWLRDIGADDIEVQGSLDEAKALARATLETLARERTSRFRPRTAFIVDADTREVLVTYRLTDHGPVEIPRASTPPPMPGPRARIVEDVDGAKS